MGWTWKSAAATFLRSIFSNIRTDMPVRSGVGRRRRCSLGPVLVFGTVTALYGSGCATKPPLIDVHTVSPSIVEEMRYAGAHNFIGRPIHGYQAARCLLSGRAAAALAKVQNELNTFGLSL